MGALLLVISICVILFSWYLKNLAVIGRDKPFLECADYYYVFNDRFNVPEPEVRLQEKRFDIDRMLVDIEREKNPPKGFDKYTVGGATTGWLEKWNVDNVVLGSMCNFLILVARYYLRELTPAADKQRCLDIMGDWLDRYDAKLPNPIPPNRFPWGNNWYEFSISSSSFLFNYMICVYNVQTDKLQQAIALLFRIIETPLKSLGWARDQANSIYMGLPWIVAHYFNGTVEEAAKHPDYQYVVDYIKFPVVKERKKEGLYMDYTYITHTNVLAYGYLSEMTKMSKPIVSFDNLMRDFLLDWKRGQRILSHPTMTYGPIGFYSRDKRLTAPTNSDSPLGIKVIPTCLFLRMYHTNYSFAVRGQNEWIAYYESDKTDDDMSQYWVQYRGVRFLGEEHTLKFPDIGFFYVKTLKNGNPVTTRCRIPTRTETTTPFTPQKWKKKPIKYGFAFAYGNIGMMRHFYKCQEMVYEAPDYKYGGFEVDEYILCDYAAHTVHVWIRIRKTAQYTMILNAETTHEWPSGSSAQGIFHMAWDCTQKKLTSKFDLHESSSDAIAEYYPTGIKVVSTNNTVMLLENDKPKLAMYPDDWTELYTNFDTVYEDKTYTFVFNEHTNQYWLDGLCIDK